MAEVDNIDQRIADAVARAMEQRQDREELIARTAAAAAIAAAENKETVKKSSAERSKTMSFFHDPTKAERAVFPWPGAALRIPKDLVELARHGQQPPLIWLTVEGISEATSQHRKPLTFPLDRKGLEQVTAAKAKDQFLPRGPFDQAMQALVALWTAVGPTPGEDQISQAQLLGDMHASIIARATDEHWPIWRSYALRVLEWIWEDRTANEGIGLDITKIDSTLLQEAERKCKQPPGHADDFTRASDTLLAQLIRAEGAQAAELGKKMDELHQRLAFGPPLPSADEPKCPTCGHELKDVTVPSTPATPATPAKRKEREFDSPPFRAASLPPYSRDSGATTPRGPRGDRSHARAHEGTAQRERTAQFCSTCLQVVSGHDFRSCRTPFGRGLEDTPRGWRRIGEQLPFCHRYNCGMECIVPGKCTYGHYCSACDKPGCRAKSHVVPRH
ncbi:hypothetical protein CF326_g7081 [Tilletia indica]|nr:hypothetical protein CF326_g7081 [Tilletia indica]